ncbi:hypothetical protein A3C26_01605 [Candidatus Daviesbacteria bacterium RIFCSPHIGHO2_02_FULL_39_12]|uniref:Arginine deiminase n=2 Tax=Candidatus Daviesiibacteriota TaxID=1752718 RepID=A0A1F5JCX0_9BACT|nr:MAG: hypothetical protein A3C26_01605 [Candidatus Daviesbacteria bacterium RIFCSPHIGHO2_02_FULL_39_12]OGE72873.1 MAG: hypothetical protein A3H40_01845 [Candidatus Daviesbacteria bacterium RIFCSPLOWO2_02_FULL_38_15]
MAVEVKTRPILRVLEGSRVSVFDETDPLKRVAVWGPPSIEAVLGQLLPPDKSLFHNNFDVFKGRKEFEGMVDILKAAEVEVLEARGKVAAALPFVKGMPSTLSALSERLKVSARVLEGRYGRRCQYTEEIDDILASEVKVLGEEGAIKLNYLTALGKPYPMANLIYGRDQTNVLGETMIFSRLRHGIRRPEVAFFRVMYQDVLDRQDVHAVRNGGYFEGGDGIMFDHAAFVGVGIRSSMNGAFGIFTAIEPVLKKRGFDFFAVVEENQERLSGSINGGGIEMDDMHLDTFWMPIGPKKVLTCLESAGRRVVRRVWRDGAGFLRVSRETSFISLMAQRGIEIYDIPVEEQRNYATNYLLLGKNQVLVPLSENYQTRSILQRAGLVIIPADIKELVGGYGAVHCMTAALERG